MVDKCPDSLREVRPTILRDPQSLETKTLAKFLAKNFIARSDVKAQQRKDILGAYRPVDKPWTMTDFANHFAGFKTYGHYLLDTDSTCKIFAFDLDFKRVGRIPTIPLPIEEENVDVWLASFEEANLRDVWLDRSHPAREWMKIAMRESAGKLALSCYKSDVPHLTSYTGSKGLHVYGINLGKVLEKETDRVPASDAYELSKAILESVAGFELSKGNVFYQWPDETNLELSLFEIELFPKQTQLSDGGYGNLMRLPYGINLKAPKDPTFFIDETLPQSQIRPASFGQIFDALN